MRAAGTIFCTPTFQTKVMPLVRTQPNISRIFNSANPDISREFFSIHLDFYKIPRRKISTSAGASLFRTSIILDISLEDLLPNAFLARNVPKSTATAASSQAHWSRWHRSSDVDLSWILGKGPWKEMGKGEKREKGMKIRHGETCCDGSSPAVLNH